MSGRRRTTCVPLVMPGGGVALVRGSFTDDEVAAYRAAAREAAAGSTAVSHPPATVPGVATTTLGDTVSESMFETPTSGEMFVNAEHVGDLLVVKVHRTEEGVQTENGLADVIVCDVTVINDDGTIGDEYDETMIFGRVFYGQMKRKLGRTFVGVWHGEPGVKRNGKNVPYQLNPATPEQIALATRAMQAKVTPPPASSAPAAAESGPAPTELPVDDAPPWARK